MMRKWRSVKGGALANAVVVIDGIAKGKAWAPLQAKLGLSDKTVKNYLSHVFETSGVEVLIADMRAYLVTVAGARLRLDNPSSEMDNPFVHSGFDGAHHVGRRRASRIGQPGA
jgi:hypothetical protein